MSSSLLFTFVIGYFLVLLLVAWRTSRNANNESFFIGNRNSNWMLVAFGMIGTSLSGVTFVSVPGTVGAMGDDGIKAFGYFQVVIGNYLEIHETISFRESVRDLTPDFPEIGRRQTLAVPPLIEEGSSKASYPNNSTLIVEKRIQTV